MNTELKERIKTNQQKLLTVLMIKAKEGITNIEIDSRVPGKWSARMSELRKKGFDIETSEEKKGIVRYFYRGYYPKGAEYTAIDRISYVIKEKYNNSITSEQLKSEMANLEIFFQSKGNYKVAK